MGWAVDDEPKRELLKIAVTRTRQALYEATSALEKVAELTKHISHVEKRKAMEAVVLAHRDTVTQMRNTYQGLYELDKHLSR